MAFDPSKKIQRVVAVDAPSSKTSAAEGTARESWVCGSSEATDDLRAIRYEVELHIHWERSGGCSTWWGSHQDQVYMETTKRLEARLDDCKLKAVAKGVDIDAAIRNVFSRTDRVWENDPEVPRLVREWASSYQETRS